ncbi:ABC transporter permease [Allorhizocola rhizosphaerae]|uniref:ABC transporter permease n=1 Tax=Allorhizocola rhizosphaerae TaxID=1872709 RepID=UPI001FEB14EE|nr:ABC transporter permease [Allorhizocola rhizosphaerae]
MLTFLLRRLVSAVSVIFLTLIASFSLFYLAPTDPAGVVCGPRCTPQRLAEIEKTLRVHDPVITQFTGYVKGLFVGRDYTTGGVTQECSAPCLGYSFTLGQPVTKLIANALPVTVSIVLGAAFFYLLIGIMAGTLSARVRGTMLDRVVVAGTLTLSSIPYFVVALISALFVAGVILPGSEWVPITENPLGWAGGLLAAWVTLGIVNAASYTRYTRASMIESLGEDYVRTARAKGISEKRVVYRHGLRAAVTPVATIFGLDLAGQLAGAVFTETIFGLPGLGRLTIQAFSQYDLPVLMATVLIGAVALVTMNLIVDIVYSILDPRVRLR